MWSAAASHALSLLAKRCRFYALNQTTERIRLV